MSKIPQAIFNDCLKEVSSNYRAIINLGMGSPDKYPTFIRSFYESNWFNATDYDKIISIITFYDSCKRYPDNYIKAIGKKPKDNSAYTKFFKLFFEPKNTSPYKQLMFIGEDIKSCYNKLDKSNKLGVDNNISTASAFSQSKNIEEAITLKKPLNQLLTSLPEKQLKNIQTLIPYLTEKHYKIADQNLRDEFSIIGNNSLDFCEEFTKKLNKLTEKNNLTQADIMSLHRLCKNYSKQEIRDSIIQDHDFITTILARSGPLTNKGLGKKVRDTLGEPVFESTIKPICNFLTGLSKGDMASNL